MSVLLVEDDIDHASLVRRGLPDKEYDVTHVRTGSDAMERALKEQFDACLVDHRLPDRTGLEVCQKIREENPQGLILLVTSVTRDELAKEAFQVGVNDYLVKGPGLVDRIKQQLEEQGERGN